LRLPSASLRAFVELRGRLLVRRFLSPRGVPELVARVVVFAMSGLAAILFSGAIAAGTYRAAKIGRGLETELAVSAIFFGIWQTWTAVALTLAERDTLDLRRFLAYPLPPGRIYAYGLVASAAGDPFALFWCVLLGGGFVGAALARPGGWLALLGLAFALFVAATVAYVALLQELLGRLVRIRRAREAAIALVYLGLVLLIALLASGQRRSHGELLGHLRRIQWIAWPAALAAAAARQLFTGHLAAALPALAGLAGGGAATGWLSFRLALADALSGEEGGRRKGRGSAVARGLPVGAFGPRLGPLVEKEWQYLLRHPLSLVMALVIPALAALVAWRAVPHIPREAGEVVAALPLFGFALYAHMVTQPFWLNGFGWDREGTRLFFLAPISLSHVLAAKNVAAASLSVVIFAGCVLATVAVAGRPPGWVIAGGFALHAGLAPWLYAAGNVVTAANPIGAGFTLARGSRLPMLSGLAGMAATALAAALFAVPVLVALKLDTAWLLPPAWLGLGAIGLALLQRTLPAAGRLVERRREQILDAVCTEDE
jgi:ABC-2 type transport system permease protein